MKRKIIAVFAIFLLLSIPFGIVEAAEEKENRSISMELGMISEEGNIQIQEFFTDEEELRNFLEIMDLIFENIKDIEDIQNLIDFLKRFSGEDNNLFSRILRLFTKNKIFGNRAFIMSSGSSYDFNPLKRTRFKIRKSATFWRYSEGNTISRTVIIKPFKLHTNTLTGTQFGFMSKFTGIYMHIHRRMPEKGYTFFMGTAKNAFGIDFSTNVL